MANRTVVRIQWDAEKERWVAKHEGQPLYCTRTKQGMLAIVRPWMNNLMQHGFMAQLVVHEKDGTIGYEHTYPDTTPKAVG